MLFIASKFSHGFFQLLFAGLRWDTTLSPTGLVLVHPQPRSFNIKLEVNCDFSSNNNVWTRFYAFFCWPFLSFVISIMTADWSSSSIKLSATGRVLDITYMCYEYRTPLFPAQLLQARQSDLSVTSIPQSVNRWRHNEYSWCSHPLHFVQASNTPVVKVRLVVWRSDLTGQGADWLEFCLCFFMVAILNWNFIFQTSYFKFR